MLKDTYHAARSPQFKHKAQGYLSTIGYKSLGACRFAYGKIKDSAIRAKMKIDEEGAADFGKETLDTAAGIGIVIIDKSFEGIKTAYQNTQQKGLTEYTKEVTCKGIDAIAGVIYDFYTILIFH
mgnify:FL=1